MSETFAWLCNDIQKTRKLKFWLCYRLWSKCVPMNLKQTPMTLKIKLTHIFGPLNITFSLRCLFSAKMVIFCVFCHIAYWELKQFQWKWPRWLFLVHWNIFLPLSHQNSKLPLFAFLHITIMGMWNLQTPCTGVPVNRFQNFYHLWYCKIILHILRVGK